VAVEDDKIDADLDVELCDVMGLFHEEGHAGAAVVGADKGISPLIAVRFLIGNGPGVVMRAKNDAASSVRPERDDHVRHLDRVFLTVLLSLEARKLDLAPFVLEVFLEQFLLGLHALATADAWADLADLLEIDHRPLAVKGSGGDLQWRLVAVRGKATAVTSGRPPLLGFEA